MEKQIAGEPLNILHTIGMKQLYPIVRMQLIFTDKLDVTQLKRAIKLVTQAVPQLKSVYNLADNSWQVAERLVEQILVEIDDKTNPDALKWDLFKEPQLKIYDQHLKTGDVLYIYLSHILSDGGGFKQLIYLLADCYNRGEAAIKGMQNDQDINEIITAIGTASEKMPLRTDHPHENYFFPEVSKFEPETAKFEVHNFKIPAEFFSKMRQTAKLQTATVNDLFLTAYLRTLAYYCDQSQLSLACPTDLRQFLGQSAAQKLRVANFTARYNLTVAIDPNEPFATSLLKVHQEMQQLKRSKQFLSSITELLTKYQQQTPTELRQIAEADYHIRPISYTNLGIVDEKRLQFNQAPIKECIFSGAFRRYPNYQVAFSSFKGDAQLVFNMIGTTQEQLVGQQLLTSIAADMFNFAYGLEGKKK